MWPPFYLTTSCKRTLAFVTTFLHKSSEKARHNFTMWALSCVTFSGLLWNTFSFNNPHKRNAWINIRATRRPQFVTLMTSSKPMWHHTKIKHLIQEIKNHHFTNWWYLSHFPWTTAFIRTYATSILWCYSFNGMIKWYDISCTTLYVSVFWILRSATAYWHCNFMFLNTTFLHLSSLPRVRFHTHSCHFYSMSDTTPSQATEQVKYSHYTPIFQAYNYPKRQKYRNNVTWWCKIIVCNN